MAATAERRYLAAGKARLKVETRGEGQPPTIEGYGAVFYREGDPGTEYELWQDTYERILPGAFDLAAAVDVRSLFNHDPNWVLGRTAANTLLLAVDGVGLRYAVTPPDTQAVRDQIVAPIRRGDVDGSSFMFWPRRVKWIQETRDGRDIEVRQIEKVELLEVGPVTWPAYAGTTSQARAAGQDLAEVRAELESWRRNEGDAARRRRDAEDSAAWVGMVLRRRRRLT